MKKRIRLTENDLKSIVLNSVKRAINEGINNCEGNTHFAISKTSGKIVNAWNYSGYDADELRRFKKDYFINDLIGYGINPKKVKILSGRSLLRQGIDPNDDSNWENGDDLMLDDF